MQYEGTLEQVCYAKSVEQMRTIEGYIQLHVRPKPWWVPKRVYMRVLNRILYIALFKVTP